MASVAVAPAPRHAPAPWRPDEDRLWRRARTGDGRAREGLVERYLPLARMLARRYARTSEPLEDLEQVAYLGLVQAVDRFDSQRGTAFSSFAVPTILGELRRHFRDRTWAVRVPRNVRELSVAAERAADGLAAELGRTPSADEVARVIGASTEQVLEAREASAAYRCESLDRPVRGEEEGSLTLGDRLGAPDARIDRAEQAIFLDQLASMLCERDREIIRLRFQEDLLQREIADRVGISQMHVSRVLREGVRRLQERAR